MNQGTSAPLHYCDQTESEWERDRDLIQAACRDEGDTLPETPLGTALEAPLDAIWDCPADEPT